MALTDSLTKLRRFLRDPDSLIWSDDDLLAWWNEAQIELAQKASILERCEAHYYPPRYDWSYMRDWEYQYTEEGDKYICLVMHQPSQQVICYPWEAGWWLTTMSTPDDGDRYTQPWEAAYCSPAEPPEVPLHKLCDALKFVAYDQVRITPLSGREISAQDLFHKTRTGEVTNYYHPDDSSNRIIPYPIPSDFVFQDYADSDVFDDSSGIVTESGDMETSLYGFSTDVISTTDALFMAYSFLPRDTEAWEDETEWPDWALKYVEYGTLERAFGADTDGYIPSLRDYWKLRKEIGIKALQKFMRMRTQDRDYRLGGNIKPISRRGGSLGSHYPAI